MWNWWTEALAHLAVARANRRKWRAPPGFTLQACRVAAQSSLLLEVPVCDKLGAPKRGVSFQLGREPSRSRRKSYQVLVIGWASVLKTTFVKSSVSDGAKSR